MWAGEQHDDDDDEFEDEDDAKGRMLQSIKC